MALQHELQLTETAKANLLFGERAQEIPGVVLVEPFGGQTIGEQSFRVYLRNGDLDAEYRIYDLMGEICDNFPAARLRVCVLEESDLTETVSTARPAAASR
jgi:hypothetical protein